MKGCGVELRVSDLQMNAWTWRENSLRVTQQYYVILPYNVIAELMSQKTEYARLFFAG